MQLHKARLTLEDLSDQLPEGDAAQPDGHLEVLRSRMDKIDTAILHLLNERAVCANVIGGIKVAVGIPIYVPSREAQVIRNVLKLNEGPLPKPAVKRLFERIIDETRSLERHTYQEPTDDDGNVDTE